MVELVDAGAGDRLTTVINARGMAADAFGAPRPPARAGSPDAAPVPVAP